jgi:hypothetical protein
MLPRKQMKVLGIEKIGILCQHTHHSKKAFTSLFLVRVSLHFECDEVVNLPMAITEEFSTHVAKELSRGCEKLSVQYNQVLEIKFRIPGSYLEDIVQYIIPRVLTSLFAKSMAAK